jgi:hypothetical protein
VRTLQPLVFIPSAHFTSLVPSLPKNSITQLCMPRDYIHVRPSQGACLWPSNRKITKAESSVLSSGPSIPCVFFNPPARPLVQSQVATAPPSGALAARSSPRSSPAGIWKGVARLPRWGAVCRVPTVGKVLSVVCVKDIGVVSD